MPQDSESFQEKTEDPTPKKEREAREKGQIPRSKEVTTAFVLLASAWIVKTGLGETTARMRELFGYMTVAGDTMPQGARGMARWLRSMGFGVLETLAMPLGTLAAVGAVVGALQAQGVVSFEPLKPQASRISPKENLSQIFSSRSVANLLKSLLKLVIVSVAVYLALDGAWTEIMALTQESPRALLEVAHEYGARVLMYAGIAFLALAAADYGFQVWKHKQDMKMTKEEVKRERKDTEGDPQIEQRRESMGRALTRNRMIQSVPDADVVVTNPTHIAAALEYDPDEAEAPIVTAIGARKVAQRIKQIARDAGVPVMENKPLARALWENTEAGTVIPPELYVAVAEVLAFVFRQRGDMPSGAHAGEPGRAASAGGDPAAGTPGDQAAPDGGPPDGATKDSAGSMYGPDGTLSDLDPDVGDLDDPADFYGDGGEAR